MISANLLVLIVSIAVCWFGCCQANSHIDDVNEIADNSKCRDLCELCDCIGFYCGEECICDCKEEDKDVKCVEAMQKSCRNLNLPFEVLIQGPKNSRFLHKLVTDAKHSTKFVHRVRSIVSIFKPDTVQIPTNGLTKNTAATACSKSKPKQSMIVALSEKDVAKSKKGTMRKKEDSGIDMKSTTKVVRVKRSYNVVLTDGDVAGDDINSALYHLTEREIHEQNEKVDDTNLGVPNVPGYIVGDPGTDADYVRPENDASTYVVDVPIPDNSGTGVQSKPKPPAIDLEGIRASAAARIASVQAQVAAARAAVITQINQWRAKLPAAATTK